jgi:hypothetical protein
MKRLLVLLTLLVVSSYAEVLSKNLTEKTCSQCHSIAIVYEQKGDAQFWNEVIDAMYVNGLEPLTRQERVEIINYLVNKTYKNTLQQAFRRNPLPIR